VFGDQRLGQLRAQDIAVWRMTIAAGHRFEATQALRQVLSRAVAWGMIDINPAKISVDNPQRRRTEKRPFESWAQLAEVIEARGALRRACDVRGGYRATARGMDRRRVGGVRAARVPRRPA